MKSINWWIVAAVFVTGFSLVWIVTPIAQPSAVVQGEPDTRSGNAMERSGRLQPRSENNREKSRLDGLLESAAAVGYENPLYFSRVFASQMQLTPSTYRANHRWSVK